MLQWFISSYTSIKILLITFTAKILPPNRPTRIFASTREERAQKRQATQAAAAAAVISRPIRSPADEYAIKKAQEKKAEEEKLAAERYLVFRVPVKVYSTFR